jgi:hypothetical protein
MAPDIYLFLLFFIIYNNHRLRYLLAPGTVKRWESPHQSWGFTDNYSDKGTVA